MSKTSETSGVNSLNVNRCKNGLKGQYPQRYPEGISHGKQQQRRWYSLVMLGLLSCLLGLGLALGSAPPTTATPAATPAIGTIDPVPPRLQAAQQAYLKRCGSCHVALPPQVLPTETWQVLITDLQHYGTVLPRLAVDQQNLIVKYLQAFTYALNPDETTPFKVGRSRYFRVLHPQIELPKPVTLEGCVSCHPGAKQFDYRSLNP
jgi:Dihaem cytochrome c